MGLRCGAPAAAIVALVEAALAQARGLAPHIDFAQASLVTVDSKRVEPGLHEAAALLRRELNFISRAALIDAGAGVATRSKLSQKHYGVGSVAEAAALAGAGPDARLLVKRMAREGVTCAVAAGWSPSPIT